MALIVVALLLVAWPAAATAKGGKDKPDLTASAKLLSAVEAAPGLAHVLVGDDGHVNLTIKLETRNTSTAGSKSPPSTTYVYLQRKGAAKKRVASQSYGPLKPGEKRSETGNRALTVTKLGQVELIVCADGPDKVDERNEDNNCDDSGSFTFIPRVWNVVNFILRQQPGTGAEQIYQASGEPASSFRFAGIRSTAAIPKDSFYYAPEGEILGSWTGVTGTSPPCTWGGGGTAAPTEGYLALSPQGKPVYHALWWPGPSVLHPFTLTCPGGEAPSTGQVPYGVVATPVGPLAPWDPEDETLAGSETKPLATSGTQTRQWSFEAAVP